MINKLHRLLKLLISIIFYCLYKIFSGFIFIIKKKIPSDLVVITFHSIPTEQTSEFAEQMTMLLKTGTLIKLDCPVQEKYNRHYLAVTFDDGYQSVIHNALPILKQNKIPATIFIPSSAFGKKPPWILDATHPFARETVLTEEQLKTLPEDLITIGSHTDSHCRLSNIDSYTFKREIVDSKKKLEFVSGRNISLISVPYGQFDKKYTKLFKEAGYQKVFLNIPTFPATNTDLFIMGRISVEPDDWTLEFRLKLQGAYQWLPFAIRIKNKLLSLNGLRS